MPDSRRFPCAPAVSPLCLRRRTRRAVLTIVLLAAPALGQPTGDPFSTQVARLQGDDPHERYHAVLQLERHGPRAGEAMLSALGDRSDMVSARAQRFLMEQGRMAVPLLVDTLASAPEDRGLFATIAGGEEAHQGKSIAATLWLAIGRGVVAAERPALLDELMAHPSPRVRSVAVFTAVTMRDPAYLPILERAATDDDPLVARTLRQGLVRLLQKASYSTPAIDATVERAAVDLLTPHLVAAAEDRQIGFGEGPQTYGEVLAYAPLTYHRARLAEALRQAIDREVPTPWGEANLGRALLHQTAPNDVASTLDGLVPPRPEEGGAARLPPSIVAASTFPGESFSATTAKRVLAWLEASPEPANPAARLAAGIALRADGKGEPEVVERAVDVAARLLASPSTARPAAIAIADQLGGWRGEMVPSWETLRGHLTDATDRLWQGLDDASAKDLCDLVGVFLVAGDARFFDVFERAWAHHPSTAQRDERDLAAALGLLGWSVRDARLVPLLLPYLDQAPTAPHSYLRDSAAAVLAAGLGRHHATFLDAARFDQWLTLFENPEVHPRLRARLTMLVSSEALDEAQRARLEDAMIAQLDLPIDRNLRDKILSRLLYRGDRRVLPDAYAMLIERDQVHWAYSNVIGALPGAAWSMAPAELVDILAGLLRRFGPDDERVVLVPSNSYFNWSVQYQIYPPRRVADELANRIGVHHGYDVEAWRAAVEAAASTAAASEDRDDEPEG